MRVNKAAQRRIEKAVNGHSVRPPRNNKSFERNCSNFRPTFVRG